MMNTPPFHRGDIVELDVRSFAFEGKSVARVNDFVVFVTKAVPGDRVRARIVTAKRTFAEAVAIEVLEASEHRITPRCPHFGVCGGCKWQHVSYEEQLALKRQNIVDSFERIGGFRGVEVRPTLGSIDPYFYRNKMEFSFSDRAWLTEADLGREVQSPSFVLGLHPAERFDKVLDINECFLQSPVSNHILSVTRRFFRERNVSVYSNKEHEGHLRYLVIREGKKTGDRMVNLVTLDDRPKLLGEYAEALLAGVPQITTIVNSINTRRAQIAVGERERVPYGPGTITEELGGLKFRISANSFFQTNTLQTEVLYETAVRLAELNGNDVVYDLYSGTGTIGIFVAPRVSRVIGIELVASAVADARENARFNGVTNCDFLEGDLLDLLARSTGWMKTSPKPTVLIIDPPRSGMHPDAVTTAAQMGVDRLVYVGCNPATQARDVKILAELGYQIEVLQPVDMFPHTYHVENVAFLRHK